MKLRILTIALLTSLLLIQPSTGTAQKGKRNRHAQTRIDRWYVFVSPDGDFTLSFPEKPNLEADASGPVTPITSYGLYTENRMRFSINFTEVPGDPNSRLANEWNDGVEQELLSKDREEKRRVVHTQRIGKNIFEAEIWDSGTDTGESINYIRQTIVRHGRIYTLLCGSEIYGRPMNKSICRRFFSSMQFITQNARSSR
jgi:hypothetical protein